jgi:uncharacterized repeat protein (TIGR03803 family)
MRCFAALALVLLPLSSLAQTAAFDPTFSSIGGNGIIQASDGNFYTTTGSDNLTQISPSGGYSTNSSIPGDNGGPPVQGSDGPFYIVNNEYVSVVYGINAPPYQVYFFCSDPNCTDGDATVPDGYVQSSLIEGTPGNFYGTAFAGGAGGGGVIFRVTKEAYYYVLYNFNPASLVCSSGSVSAYLQGKNPGPFLVQGSDGALYGTTYNGGSTTAEDACNSENVPSGTIFRLSLDGTFTTLHTFYNSGNLQSPSAVTPIMGLSEGPDGNFYGVTQGERELFSISPDGTFKTIAKTTEITSTPVWASDGNMYATTGANGRLLQYSLTGGLKTLYDDGGMESLLYSPLLASDGRLYGPDTISSSTDTYSFTLSPALPPPVQLTLSATSITAGQSVTLSWRVLNAFSATMQQCAAFIQGGSGGGNWSGQQSGSYQAGVLSGAATLTPTASGTYQYALTCGGRESGYAAPLNVAAIATSTTLALSSPSVGPNSTFRLNAQVVDAGGTINPTGSVTFYIDGYAQPQAGNNGLSSTGGATEGFYAAGFEQGTHEIYAVYSGDAEHSTSTSATQTFVITGTTVTATALSVSPNPVMAGNYVTISATVKETAGSAVPTGDVQFSVNGSVLNTVALNGSGIATFGVSTVGYALGTYNLVATYIGDANNASSVSGTVAVTLEGQTTTTTLTASPNPVTQPNFCYLTATVSSSGGQPTGHVNFSVNGQVFGSATLVNGMTMLYGPTSAIAAGSYPVVATYSGGFGYAPSSSPPLTITIAP